MRVPLGVAYGSDLEQVEAVLLAVAAANPAVVKDPEARVRLRSFGSSSLDFELLCCKRSQGTTSCGDRSGSRTKVRIAVPLAATCGTL